MEHLRGLYYTRNKHTYLIAKELIQDDVSKRPFMPGKYLLVELPHLFDEILHLGLQNIPGVGTHKAFRCNASIDTLARDRTGMLAEFEPPDFSALVKKCMS